MRSLLNPLHKLEVSQYKVFCSAVAVLAGQATEALPIVAREIPVAEDLGAPFIAATFQMQFAQILVLNGRHEAARQPLRAALGFARLMPSRILEFQAVLTTAWALLRGGNIEEGLTTLRVGLGIGRDRHYMNCHPLWIPDMARELFAHALDAGIEVDYVRRFIRHRRLSPGSPDVASWPWPIRIVTLGGFEIVRDDAPLHVAGKVPQRVLDLMKAIVAQGPYGADADELAALLWPDADGDAGRHALRVTVHRLRRLLGFDEAIRVADSRIGLDPDWCFVDAFAFERAADTAATTSAHAARLLELYRGPFLAPSERAWMLPTRERLRSKFLRGLEGCAAAAMAADRFDDAADLFRRGIESDPLAESLYRGLMRCRARHGRIAEGMDAYRRCREMLSVVLGVRPTAQTEALREELLALQSLGRTEVHPAGPPRRPGE